MPSDEIDMDNGKLMLSIVIPVLNSETTLAECLKSIERQVFDGEVETIIADGGSTDGTLDIAREYGCLVVENPKKTGEAGKAAGLKRASGEIVALIDALRPPPPCTCRLRSRLRSVVVMSQEKWAFLLRQRPMRV